MKERKHIEQEEFLDRRLELRISQTEYEFLKQKAKSTGASISKIIRSLVFDETSACDTKLNESEVKNSTLNTLLKIQSEYKNIAKDYNNIVETYIGNIGLRSRSGEPMVNVSMTIRTLRSLEGLTIELQKSINRLFEEQNGVAKSEIHPVRRRREIREEFEKAEQEEINKLYFMEKIEIIGRLVEDATIYKNQNGTEKVRIKIGCENVGKDKKKFTREWLVFYSNTAIVDRLKKGKGVFVSGDFGFGDKGEFIVFPDILKFMSD